VSAALAAFARLSWLKRNEVPSSLSTRYSTDCFTTLLTASTM